MASIAIPGYRLTEQIYSGSRTEVYRGISESDTQPIVIKLLKSDNPPLNEQVQFRNQYTIAKNLDLPGVVKHLRLQTFDRKLVLVLEDFGGISLKEEMQKFGERGFGTSADSLKEFLQIAIHVVESLEGLYQNRVIHKDIKPDNILINPETRQIKLIDFSISTLLPKENQEIQNPNVLEGTLPYMSPEQTGRMNKSIDYRTDFYSLGVTFYELLTGKLPFQSDDPMELVHCHIARKPVPPIDVNPLIPQVLSNMVIKLMAKTAEERYQSAFGIRYDLEKCLQEYSAKGRISPFDLAKRDIAERFSIPETLYGREAEVATLLAAFDRVSFGSTEMMLVAGFSGIGKTAIVNEVHKPIVRQRGYFIKGKYDQFKRDIPFSAWVQAFQNLIRQLLTESAADLAEWKAKILAALGENGQVIIDVIPELEILIGKQPPLAELEGSAAQNRFNLLFQNFMQVFATKEHPLVIFLDDLQWADLASLKLMQLLMSEKNSHNLLLIGAYRDNEVSDAHPFMLTLDEIRKESAIINQIILAPLDQTSLNRLIADTLSCPPLRAMPLTELVFQKTKGNPFFSNQFLKSLYEEGLIFFDFNSGYWQCDIAGVRALSLSDDIVEFMATQLQKFPENTREVLKLGACIGNQFDLATLAIVHEKSQGETAADLWKALQEGLVIPVGEVYKLFQESEPTSADDRHSSVRYKFLHDRVQQAGYFLIPESQKQSTHLKIGQLLLSNTPPAEREELIFDIVNQLNIGKELITKQTERIDLAQLNLIAGRKAMVSTAYAAAIRYLSVGIELLPDSSWQNQYDLTLGLYESVTEASYLNGDFEQMEKFAAVVLQHAKTVLDKVKVYEAKIYTYTQINQHEALKVGLEVLKLLGVNLPNSPTQSDIQRGLEETNAYLKGKNIPDLINLPLMQDASKQAALRIISSLAPAAYNLIPPLFMLMGFEQVKLSIEYGNAHLSTSSYADYAGILCGLFQDIENGYQFGELAFKLLERLNAKELKSKIFFKVPMFTWHRKHKARETLSLLQESYKSGLETGDMQHVGYSAFFKCQYSFFCGLELTELEREIKTFSNALAQLKQEKPLNYNEIFRQVVLNLKGQSENPCVLNGEAYNEEQSLADFHATNNRIGLHNIYLSKQILYYLFGQPYQAIENAVLAEEYLDSMTGMLCVPAFYLYDSLARLETFNGTKKNRGDIFKKVKANQDNMQKWTYYAPTNYLHKYYLIEAEQHRVLANFTQATYYYDRAIALAKENEFIHEEALAYELSAKMYLAWGKEKIAKLYLTDAYYTYERWGATAKLADLQKCYPELLSEFLPETTSFDRQETILEMKKATVTSTSGSMSQFLDLGSVIKASQAISGEINLGKLLSKLMEVAIENAGASKGALMLISGENLVLEAVTGCPNLEKYRPQNENSHNSNLAVKVLPSVPVSESQEIPLSVINYVFRTQEVLVLANATTDATFAADRYIIQHQPKSLLCVPIVNQGKAIGILYLENNLATGAFTPARLEVLKILSSQAAISLENARLYQTLIAKNEELRIAEENYRSIFENALEGIFQATPSGRYISVNPAMARTYGYDSPDEMIASIGNIGSEIYVDSSSLDEFYHLMQSQGKVKDFEYRAYRKDGGIIWVQEDARAVRDGDGNVLYFEGIIQDVTERRRKEEDLQRQLQELRIEIDQQKRQQEVAAITQSDYFQEIQAEAGDLELDDFWN
ncbi:AAA family ATPase [Aerosakkonema funiforme]|uniref:AAA family ATPase n=1 Tax=Aerosakkonema funiforme TaxID=1246630 RepID=UPI0035B926B2